MERVLHSWKEVLDATPCLRSPTLSTVSRLHWLLYCHCRYFLLGPQHSVSHHLLTPSAWLGSPGKFPAFIFLLPLLDYTIMLFPLQGSNSESTCRWTHLLILTIQESGHISPLTEVIYVLPEPKLPSPHPSPTLEPCVCSVASVTSDSLWPHDCSLPESSVIGFSRQEYWSELPCPSPGDLPNSETESESLMPPALAGEFFTTNATWETWEPYSTHSYA